MDKDYKIVKGMIYMRSPYGNWRTLAEAIDCQVQNKNEMIWFLSIYELPEDMEDIAIECWKRIEMEREFKSKKYLENIKRIAAKLK